MIVTLRESKARLSALVALAAEGEEVVITVRGTPRARICPLGPAPAADGKDAWAERLAEVRAEYSVGAGTDSGPILDELRGDR